MKTFAIDPAPDMTADIWSVTSYLKWRERVNMASNEGSVELSELWCNRGKVKIRNRFIYPSVVIKMFEINKQYCTQ
jgi:hypothetical protein